MTTTPTPGCWIDSHLGHYANPQTVRIAQDFGMVLGAEDQSMLDRYDADYWREDYPHDALIDLSDEAVQFLNDRAPLDGHVWEWNDGDFGLYPIEDDGEDIPF